MAKAQRATTEKFIAQNRKARFEYEILEALEVGIVLVGSEVKSLRNGRASLEEAYAQITPTGEVNLINCHIPEYSPASQFNHEPRRKRQLLMHKREIYKLQSKLKEKGHTLVPLSLYFKKGKAKVELALVRGKRKFDKRESLKKKSAQREIDRAMSRRR